MDTKTTTFTKEQMLEWLDETIRLEAGSDACFPNQRFHDHTMAKAIRSVVASGPFDTLKAIDPIIDYVMDLVTKNETKLDDNGESYSTAMIRLAQVQRMVRDAING